MAYFVAASSRGLIDALHDELQELGVDHLKKLHFGVGFEANWQTCYRVNLASRIATRVLMPVLDFSAYKDEELYNNTLKHDFTKYIRPDQTLMITASVNGGIFRDQRFVALKVKDAVVDQFRDKFGVRPDIDRDKPDLHLQVRINKNEVSISVDTSGHSMSQRGYRLNMTRAPLREHLASGLLQMTGWTADMPLVDPMCGSGSFLIEAALKGRNIAPGVDTQAFSFQKFIGFQKDAFHEVAEELMGKEQPEKELQLFGSDMDKKAIHASVENAQEAGVADTIDFKRTDIRMLKAPCEEKGILIMNPPYGERLGEKHELEDLYKDIAHTLKTEFKGWDCWLLSGDPELTRHLKLKATGRIPVYNGPIECRFLKYKIN